MINQKGYIALISVLIVTALVLLIASSANLASISESDMGLKEQQTWEAYYLATACAEEALMNLRKDLNYSGNETLTFIDGECTILNIGGTGNQDRTIKASGSAFGLVRKIKIEINRIRPEIEIESWQEVADF